MNDHINLQPPRVLNQILTETAAMGFDMASDRLTGSLLRTLVTSRPDGRILELGTGTGVATAWLLDGLGHQSELITVEQDILCSLVAQKYLGTDKRVTFYVADAEEIIQRIAGQEFDLIFADTWVGKYSHLEESLRLLKAGGFYVIDDMLPQPNWPEGHAGMVEELITVLESRSDLLLTKLAWSSGIIITVKQQAG